MISVSIRKLLLAAFVLLAFRVHAQQGSFAERREEQFYFEKLYARVPSSISWWKGKNRAYIKGRFANEQGDFRNPQQYGKGNFTGLKTASLSTLGNSGWTLHGSFEYENSRADSVNTNLSYFNRDHGAPFYFFIKKPGEWNLQHYGFNADISKTFANDKYAMGLSIKYDIDLAYRKIDTRNEFTKLASLLRYSLTYNSGAYGRYSMGIELYQKKTGSELHNKYPHPTSDDTYNIYFNTGLGSYFKNLTSGIISRETSPGALVQWHLDNKSGEILARYSIRSGKRKWINDEIYKATQSNIVARYDYTLHTATLFHKASAGKNSLEQLLEAEYISGTGKSRDNTLENFRKNYTTSVINAGLTNIYRIPVENGLKAISLKTRYESLDELDKSYGYKFAYSNLYAGASLTGGLYLGSWDTNLSAGADYKLHLQHSHDPKAARDNIYYNWIAIPAMAYHTTDYFQLNTRLSTARNLEHNALEFDIAYSLILPSGQGSGANKNFRHISASVSFWF
ncbi:DUF6850 family outer membrane beta-barrel protein [Sinomicrobium soli]|uniref:DUF6850 family outer membrane beta-barrel protein n=1 Tax=Sinomicrobium sp. N-1-3-6 TaxID=2219864 RepID=UPI000DCBC741|nr:DUF6850 family outer membrane beta-barrel protein [Sinomicrobium sp. N-1-3-6]RAV29083.1 hypothetical protein DN748_09155 [Sinomicrobium sp. N-1-3-6]